jgi:hypothetical protein
MLFTSNFERRLSKSVAGALSLLMSVAFAAFLVPSRNTNAEEKLTHWEPPAGRRLHGKLLEYYNRSKVSNLEIGQSEYAKKHLEFFSEKGIIKSLTESSKRVREGEVFIGIRFRPIPSGGLLSLIGMKDGDVFIAVDGGRVADPVEASYYGTDRDFSVIPLPAPGFVGEFEIFIRRGSEYIKIAIRVRGAVVSGACRSPTARRREA